MTPDRIPRAIDATLTATEDTAMTDHTPTADQLAAAQRTVAAQAEQIRRDGTLLSRLRDLDEQADRIAAWRDRAWAEHDTVTAAPTDITADRPQPQHPADALAYALQAAFTRAQLGELHETLLVAADLDADTPRDDPHGRLVDALFAAAHWRQPPTGSGQDRAHVWAGSIATPRVLAALGSLGWRDDRSDLEQRGVLYETAEDAIRAADAAREGSAQVAPPEPIRPADWEQQATDAVDDALAAAWDHLAQDPVHTEQLATTAVRAIIDTGLAGPGGHCPTCGATYPRTPDGADPRCWTCATADQTGDDDARDATLAQIAAERVHLDADIAAGRVSDHLGGPAPRRIPTTREG